MDMLDLKKEKFHFIRKELCEKNIPSEHAVEELIALIKANDDWVEPTE